MPQSIIISGAKLRSYLTCVRLPFMDEFVNRQKAVGVPELSLPDVGSGLLDSIVPDRNANLRSTSDDPQEEALAIVHAPAHIRGEALMRWTDEQMRAGADGIAGGLLRNENWLGSPELLHKRPGVSRLGTYLYEPVGRRWSGKQSIRALAIPLVFYGLLVEKIQGARPVRVSWNRVTTGELETRPLAKFLSETHDAIVRVEDMLRRRIDPGPRLKTDCERCRWRVECHKDAEEQQHVTLLPNIRSSAVDKLRVAAVTTLSDVRDAPSSLLSRATGIRDEQTLLRLRAQADAYATRVSSIVGIPDLPAKTPTEAFLDFEADATWGEPCLAGLLVRRGRRVTYTAFLAESEQDIAHACRALLRAVARLPKATRIFHYGSFERFVLSRFPRVRGYGIAEVERRLFDLLPIVRRHAAIPSRSFGLKEVAAVLGVKLPQTGLEGRVAPMWWEAWVRTQDPKYRRLLLTYNEADLRAVLALLQWLRVGPRWKRSPSRRPQRCARDQELAGR